MIAGVPAGHRHAILQDRDFILFEDGHGVGHGFQVVEQLHGTIAQMLGHYGCVYRPGHVGKPGDQTGDGSRDANAHGRHRSTRAGVIEKDLRQFVEAVEIQRGVFPHHQLPRPNAIALEQAKQCFCPADVASQKHGQMLTSATGQQS